MRIAVLDDYHDLGPARLDPVLAEWRASKTSQTAASATTGVTATAPATVTYFHDTLPQDTDAEVTALVERLEPFEVICSMRERTPFPATLLARLPNLRLLLTTGTHNRAIDIAAAAEHGIVVAGTGPSKFRYERVVILVLTQGIPARCSILGR
jgi:hypothetical protein